MRQAILVGLFLGTVLAAALPASHTLAAPETAVSVTAGEQHSCALLASGGVKCWGANFDGQFGDGTQVDSATPSDTAGLTNAVALSAGYTQTCAVTATGGAKCWGYNLQGQVGNGSPSFWITTPATPTGLGSGVVSIAGGSGHTCALLTTGGVRCWGYNAYGQLGDGTTIDRPTPVGVAGLNSGVTAIAVGRRQSCALLSAGGVLCWGLNTAGQLGVGTQTGPELCGGIACSRTPVSVSGVSDAAAIAPGGSHMCIVTSAGGAKCWGANTSGQVGDGTNDTRTTPVDVSGLTSGVEALATGGLHTCAVTGAGGAMCWGHNADGELGDGTFLDSNVPVDVSGLTSGVAAIGLGYNHSCAVLDGGGVRCWGRNPYGQLGNGTTAPSALPVGVLGLSGVSVDTDGDSCTDDAEIRTVPTSQETGGRRSPLSFWDFFDTPDQNNVRNGTIDLFGDIFSVAYRFGANDASGTAAINRNSDPFSTTLPIPAYHPAFDRSAPPQGGDPWDLGPPDGTIDLFVDIFGATAQFGHHC